MFTCYKPICNLLTELLMVVFRMSCSSLLRVAPCMWKSSTEESSHWHTASGRGTAGLVCHPPTTTESTSLWHTSPSLNPWMLCKWGSMLTTMSSAQPVSRSASGKPFKISFTTWTQVSMFWGICLYHTRILLPWEEIGFSLQSLRKNVALSVDNLEEICLPFFFVIALLWSYLVLLHVKGYWTNTFVEHGLLGPLEQVMLLTKSGLISCTPWHFIYRLPYRAFHLLSFDHLFNIKTTRAFSW